MHYCRLNNTTKRKINLRLSALIYEFPALPFMNSHPYVHIDFLNTRIGNWERTGVGWVGTYSFTHLITSLIETCQRIYHTHIQNILYTEKCAYLCETACVELRLIYGNHCCSNQWVSHLQLCPWCRHTYTVPVHVMFSPQVGQCLQNSRMRLPSQISSQSTIRLKKADFDKRIS